MKLTGRCINFVITTLPRNRGGLPARDQAGMTGRGVVGGPRSQDAAPPAPLRELRPGATPNGGVQQP